MPLKIFERDPALLPYRAAIEQRDESFRAKKASIEKEYGSLYDFADAHLYFGFHRTDGGWVYREWAPGADRVYLTGDMVSWDAFALELSRKDGGVFEIFLEGEGALYGGCHVQTVVVNGDRVLRRIPLYVRRVEQDAERLDWCGVIVDEPEFHPKKKNFTPKRELYIYECHIGMAQEREGVGTYREFTENVLPRISALGYTAIQIMAIMEHPYYGSFGYQVSSFFAASSRFGTPNELKELIDKAHRAGIAVLLDVVHSHAVSNTEEGIFCFDGTPDQFFHTGERGDHPAWGTKLFNYGKDEVVRFLLSNLRFWVEEFGFDGFRFDGVTSMIYKDHGLGECFGDYAKYFSENTDCDAVRYLQLANAMLRERYPNIITVAEDMSAMPGMCLPLDEGGIGFDYRLAMGEPDLWIKLLSEQRDEDFDMWQIWGELSGRRAGEKYIGYAESHDQALVGDKTIMFRLCDSKMYTHMSKFTQDPVISRGIALHKLIRLVTLSVGGEGYLNFMGNEFGHPEWIDFPREGNGWSHYYCRRQWHLADDETLHYGELLDFDREMIALCKGARIFSRSPECLFIDKQKQVLVYKRASLVFALNFSPESSYEGYYVEVPSRGKYKVVLNTDSHRFGGFGRVSEDYVYASEGARGERPHIRIYLPARVGIILKKINGRSKG